MIELIKKLICEHKWGNSNKLTLKHRTEYSRCRLCGATKKGH